MLWIFLLSPNICTRKEKGASSGVMAKCQICFIDWTRNEIENCKLRMKVLKIAVARKTTFHFSPFCQPIDWQLSARRTKNFVTQFWNSLGSAMDLQGKLIASTGERCWLISVLMFHVSSNKENVMIFHHTDVTSGNERDQNCFVLN